MELIAEGFSVLQQETNSKELRTCLETLITIYRNIYRNPDELKYRKLRLTNKTFDESVWQYAGSKQILLASGWFVEGVNLVLPQHCDVKQYLTFFVDNRVVAPRTHEWVEENKIVIPNAEKERDLQLRKEAFAQKEKDMAELLKDMAEREQIKKAILAEHRYDRYKRLHPVACGPVGSPMARLAEGREQALPGSRHSGRHAEHGRCANPSCITDDTDRYEQRRQKLYYGSSGQTLGAKPRGLTPNVRIDNDHPDFDYSSDDSDSQHEVEEEEE